MWHTSSRKATLPNPSWCHQPGDKVLRYGVTFIQITTTGNKIITKNYYPKNDNVWGIMGSLKQHLLGLHLEPYALVGTVECNERKKSDPYPGDSLNLRQLWMTETNNYSEEKFHFPKTVGLEASASCLLDILLLPDTFWFWDSEYTAKQEHPRNQSSMSHMVTYRDALEHVIPGPFHLPLNHSQSLQSPSRFTPHSPQPVKVSCTPVACLSFGSTPLSSSNHKTKVFCIWVDISTYGCVSDEYTHTHT